MIANGYPVAPVVGVQLYKQDVVVVRRGVSRKGVYPVRAEVKTFSRASRRRLAFVASNTDLVFTSMLTLTYPREFPNDGRKVKRDLATFRKALARKVPGHSLLWFLEFQKRGAPHIHILLRGVRVFAPMQKWVSKTWYWICATGDERHLRAGTRLERIRKPNGARNYAVKYAHKMKQKSVPEDYRNVGRFWGYTRDVKPVMHCEMQCTNDDLVGALQSTGWAYLRGETVRYHTLYGASPNLTKWLDGDMLALSASHKCHLKVTLHRGGKQDGNQATLDPGRRVWTDDPSHVRNGGGNDPRADAD